MEWRGDAIVLSVFSYGETDAVLEVLSREQGRSRGFVKGGMGRRLRPILQPGNRLDVSWRSRIAENLGRFSVEQKSSPLGEILTNKVKLSALTAVTSSLSASLPERESLPEVFEVFEALITVIQNGDILEIGSSLAQMELGVLASLGYGLDLTECAALGGRENLMYVSPKSGRAVSADAGKPYHDRLLVLPQFLLDGESNDKNRITVSDVLDGLRLTAYFLDRNIWIIEGKGEPPARARFVDIVKQTSNP